MSSYFARGWRENKSSASRLHRGAPPGSKPTRRTGWCAWPRSSPGPGTPFDSPAAARTWLRTPHGLLGGESPLEHMDTTVGMAAVKTMLYHIEYGMPA